MKRKKFLNKVLFLALFLIINLAPGVIQAVYGEEAKITAPDESVSIGANSHNVEFFTDGWICGYDLAPKVIREIRKANEISSEINRMIQNIGECIVVIKAVVDEERKKNTPEDEIANRLPRILRDFSLLKKVTVHGQ